MIKRTAALCAILTFILLCTACGAGGNTRSAESAPPQIAESTPPHTDVSAADEPRIAATKPRIAYEDRYLYFENDAIVVDGTLYCAADELKSSISIAGNPVQTIIYEGAEYAPVRAYYESAGLNVNWDDDLGLVRVYAHKPEYGEKASKKKVNVLLYHHILDSGENTSFRNNGMVISTEAFEEQMKYLSDNGFTAITLLQLYDFLYNNRELPDKSVLITFDDGYYSNFTRAYPILKKYGFCAVSFLITGDMPHAGSAQFDPDTLQYAAISDLKAYSDVFEYASHTHVLHKYDARDVTRFSKADAYTVIDDLRYSFEIANNNIALAYPLGLTNGNAIDALKTTPVKLAFTTKRGSVKSSSNPYKINRYVIWPDTGIKAFAKMLK